jgi:membrane-associated phospholipid phosphatase
VPLKVMYPLADVPALQLSIPTSDPGRLLALGARLRPLRESGVLIIGSGFLTHGLPFLTPEMMTGESVPGWSSEFDHWAAEALAQGDVETLAAFRRAPGMPYAHPSADHFLPLFVTLGAGSDPAQPASTVIDGYWMGLAKRSFQVNLPPLPAGPRDGCLFSRGAPVKDRSIARRVSYLLEPKNWIIATTLAVGWHADGPAGLAWGAVAALFAGVLPMVFISQGMRRGRWDDRYVGGKRARLIVLCFILASVAAGLSLLVGFGAPGELSVYIACMLGSVAMLAAITTGWKISIHCAVASGSVTIGVLLFGAWLTPAYLLVALTAWSRVVLKDHTRAQVIAGSVLGAAAAAVTYALMPH